jgi:RNAse (barnase) inhibitor barstar
MKLDHVLRPDAPWLEILVATASEAYDAAVALPGVGRVLRGQKMRTANALFDEVAAALQFPPYFGENWDALDECLADLEWPHAPACLLVILNAANVLDLDSSESRQTFREILERVAREWAQPAAGSKPQSARVFRVLLQAPSEQEARLRADWTLVSRK